MLFDVIDKEVARINVILEALQVTRISKRGSNNYMSLYRPPRHPEFSGTYHR